MLDKAGHGVQTEIAKEEQLPSQGRDLGHWLVVGEGREETQMPPHPPSPLQGGLSGLKVQSLFKRLCFSRGN